MIFLKTIVKRLFVKEKIRQCCNVPTILLFCIVFAMNWLFRFYCLRRPVDWSPLEWGAMNWVIFDSIITFLILRFGGVLRFPALFFVSLTGAVHLTTTHFYHHMLHYGQLASVFETNASETSEYIQFVGFYPFIEFFALMVIFWGLTFKSSRTGWLGVFVLFFVSLSPVFEIAIAGIKGERDKDVYEFYHFPLEKLKQCYVNSTIFRIPAMVGQYISIHSRMVQASKKDRVLPEGIGYHPEALNSLIPRRIIFVLGESDWRKHHGAYGYPFGTDRFMMSRRNNSENTVFFNALSPASVTRDAISRVFTFATPRDIGPFSENMGIIDMAKNAGYQTVWFSRQNWSGIYDTMVKIVAQQAESTIYYDKGRDEVLVSPLRNAVRRNHRQFLVMHIWGSHMGYGERHDESDYRLTSKEAKEFRRYDATIAHTDKVLAAVNRCADSDTLFIYMPDHGEIINRGHGFHDLYASQYEIPLIAWSNNVHYVARFKQLVQKYSIKNGSLFNTSALPYVMAELMGYRISDSARDRALDDSHYVFNVDGYAYPISDLK